MRICYAIAALIVSHSTPAHAQQATCKLQAVEKKFTGAPFTTFMQKCGDDAQKACEQLPVARRLEEPNKTLFMASCVKGFVG
jgi:hypothetical protein